MKKLLILASFVAILGLSASSARASENVVSASASFRKQVVVSDFDYRVETLRMFLEKFGSPLSIYAEDFVIYADKYNVDYRLVPAITGVESTFGKHIPYNSYNAYGWANGAYKFTSWEKSIDHVNKTLRYKYLDKGATSIGKIAKRYAPPSNIWGSKVTYFVRKISLLPVTYDI